MSARWAGIHPVTRICGLGFAVIAAFAVFGLSGPVSVGRVDAWFRGGAGGRAAVVFVVLYAGLTVISVPGPVLAGASGALFGTLDGGLLALTGALIGSVAAFMLSRHVAGDLVARVGGRRVRGLAEWVGRRGFRSIVCARAAPGAPFTAVSYAAGLTPVRLSAFASATAIVAIPRTFAYAAVGGNVDRVASAPVVIAGFVLLGMGVLGVGLGVREGAREGARRRRGRVQPGQGSSGPVTRSAPARQVESGADVAAGEPDQGETDERERQAGEDGQVAEIDAVGERVVAGVVVKDG